MTTGPDDWPDPSLVEGEVDEACDRFEAAWRAGDRPAIEGFLGEAVGRRRSTLLRYLLAVELDYRVGLGEAPEPSEYRVRFAGHERPIDRAFAEFARRLELARAAYSRTIELGTGRDGAIPGPAAGPPPEPFPEVPGFEILSELGRGGMGIVYKARNIRLNRLCALKMVLPGKHAGAEARARFFAEAETVARLKHPNLVQIYSLGEHDGRPYFEMEYFEGGNLSRRLDGTPWPPEPAARMVAMLAHAIGDAHRLGIVHRDLKPANVLLTDDETPKVVDFGLAKSLEADLGLTQSGVFVGTPSYAAPEQVAGSTRAFGPAADIYALGAIFYHMITGRPPFQAATALQTLEQVRSTDPVPPSRLQPGLARDAETIALKCLEKDPHRRYADVAALADDLGRFLAGRAILARPIGVAELLRKWVRRRPAVALLSMLISAVTLLSLILVVWQWRRAEATAVAAALARESAERARLVAFDEHAQLTFHQALALCDQGEIDRGLAWMARSLELATTARSDALARPIRVNLADWAAQRIRPLELPPMRQSSPVLGLAFRREGKALVSVGRDGVARSWDTATGLEGGPPLELAGDPELARLERARFDPAEGNLLGAVDAMGRAVVWDLDRRRRLASAPLGPPDDKVRDVAFSGSRHAITCDERGILRWFDLGHRRCEQSGQPSRVSPGRCAGPTTLALSSDGRTLVTGGPDRRVLRWDVATRRILGPALQQDSPVVAVASTPDGRRVITGRQVGRIHVWDAETERGFDLPPQGTEVTSLAVSPDGRIFASGTQGGVVRVWDADLLGQVGQTIKLDGAVAALAFDERGRRLAVGEEDGTIRLWELPRIKALGPPLRVGGPVRSVTFGEDGRRPLIATTEGALWWDLRGRVADESARARDGGAGDESSSRDLATTVSPDGRTRATAKAVAVDGQIRGRVELRDAATGRRLRESPDQPGPPSALAFSPDSRWLLAWDPKSGIARLWDVATLRDPGPRPTSMDFPILQAAFSRDGRSLLLGCRDGKARVWDPLAGAEVDPGHRPYHAYPITAVAFDPARPRLVTGCHAGTVKVWDATRRTLIYESRQNAGEIVALAFSPGGETLLTASYDGTARFLDAESGQQLGPALRHTDAVLCIAFDPDGRSVVAGTRDGMVQRWSVPPPPEAGPVAEIRSRVTAQTGIEIHDN